MNSFVLEAQSGLCISMQKISPKLLDFLVQQQQKNTAAEKEPLKFEFTISARPAGWRGSPGCSQALAAHSSLAVLQLSFAGR